MKREIELAKLQLIADLFEASGITCISNYGNGTHVNMDEEIFYRLFGDRGANEVKATFSNNDTVRAETWVGELKYTSILLIGEDQND